MRKLEAAWGMFRLAVGLQDAPPDQIREMRRAFYAGAAAFWAEVNEMLDPSTDEPTDDDLQKMTLLHGELEQFAERIKRGEA